eukprot:14218562-Heterocapsa_arctica.AAC.1
MGSIVSRPGRLRLQGPSTRSGARVAWLSMSPGRFQTSCRRLAFTRSGVSTKGRSTACPTGLLSHSIGLCA